jgi:Asp-tRNA(Asn)/Glu-tRNA(Gln) amidotransferase A subunit family amidase
VSATELVQRALRRIDRAADLNAVVALRADDALADAAALDRRLAWARANGRDIPHARLPLAGLPLLVKDVEDAAGLRTTYGSRLIADAPPAASNGLIADRLVRTGAIVVGKTNVPELALDGFTANDLFGITRNPWAPDWSPGGSSGGSAAALAAGLVPIATATDVGGSARIPASLCGLIGFKPTTGLIGRDPILPTLDMNGHGVLATTAADARLLLDILAGPTPGDPFALPRRRLGPGAPPRRIVATPRLTGLRDALLRPLDDAVATRFADTLEALSNAVGLPIEHVAPTDVLPDGLDPADLFRIVCVEQAEALGRDRLRRDAHLLTQLTRATLEAALDVPASDYHAARRRRYAYARDLDAALGADTVLVTPTLTVPGWLADGRMPGSERPGPPSWIYATQAANFGGHPAASLPADVFANGVPFGVQVIAPRARDDLVLWLAERWGEARPWPAVAPGYEPFDSGS